MGAIFVCLLCQPPPKKKELIINIAVDGPVCVWGAELCRPILLGACMHAWLPPARADRPIPALGGATQMREYVHLWVIKANQKCAAPACMHAGLLLLHVGRVTQHAAH